MYIYIYNFLYKENKKKEKGKKKIKRQMEQMPIVTFKGVAQMLFQCTLSSPQNITFLLDIVSATVGQ